MELLLVLVAVEELVAMTRRGYQWDRAAHRGAATSCCRGKDQLLR
jgi:hypothetical protein